MKEEKGFTLIELLVAITILAIISVISYVFIGNAISKSKNDIVVNNAKILAKSVIEDVKLNEMEPEKTQFYVIENDTEYMINSDGTKTETNYFKYKGESCSFCIIKINPQKEISVLLEGENIDAIKDYNSNNIVTKSLIESRDVLSLYNELALFIDMYSTYNEITGSKRFIFEGEIIYEYLNDGSKIEVYKLINPNANKSLNGNIILDESLSFKYSIELSNNEVVIIDSNGNYEKEDDVNSGYDDNIIVLYQEIKAVAKKYIKNNNITSEVYFEFNDGTINKIDQYGNIINDNSISMNSNVKGSGELRINADNKYEIIMYDGDNNIRNNYGSNILYTEKLKYPRDVATLLKNIARLELLAKNYATTATYTTANYKPSYSKWLVFNYIRTFSYTGSNWDKVSRTDYSFREYVQSNALNLKTYFNNKKSFTINDDTIDLIHMAAVIDTRMYQTASSPYDLLNQITVDSVASWAGDLQTFMVDNLLSTVTDKTVAGYKKATMNLLGNSNTSFNMDDMYADTDGWVIYYNLSQNSSLSISDAFENYYTGLSTRSYKNRFTSFKNTVLSSSSGTKSAFSNLVYKFTKENYEVDIIITLSKKWPLYGSNTISSTMSQGVRDGFVEWIYARIAEE